MRPRFADKDSVGHWAITYLATAIEQEWLNGVDRGGQLWLEPNRPITRAEAAALKAGMLGQDLTHGVELMLL